jgi:glycosyltransferase involved in cell wall biosynthesis
MTVYNHEKFVKSAIESVLNQTFNDFELIIINDGSTDRTKEIIEEYRLNPKVEIRNIEHVGRSRALNIGLKEARGEFIAIIDSDDVFLPEKLEKQVEYLFKHHDVVMVGVNSLEHDLANDKKYLGISPNDDKAIKKLLLYDSVFPFPAVMIRKCILKDVGFCNEKLRSKIDFELFGRIASKGKVANIPEALVICNRHPEKYFRFSLDPDHHRRARLKVRWLNLWRLKPPFFLFSRVLLWLCFEYMVNLFPNRIRHLIPNKIRDIFKKTKLIHPVENFSSLKIIKDL